MILISEPESRLLVSSTEADSHETTLVVAEMSRPRVEYFKCLVDPGTAFKEHAVVRWEGQLSEDEASVIVRALIASRPTDVSFLCEDGPRRADGTRPGDAASAACAVVSRLDTLRTRSATAFGFRITKTGRFYTCVEI